MLEIKNLHVKIAEEDAEIIRGLNLTVPKGEVHAIMGPNGSGKSTLAYVLAGKDDYEVTEGRSPVGRRKPAGDGAGRARPRRRVSGVPVSAGNPGVGSMTFLRTASTRTARRAARRRFPRRTS